MSSRNTNISNKVREPRNTAISTIASIAHKRTPKANLKSYKKVNIRTNDDSNCTGDSKVSTKNPLFANMPNLNTNTGQEANNNRQVIQKDSEIDVQSPSKIQIDSSKVSNLSPKTRHKKVQSFDTRSQRKDTQSMNKSVTYNASNQAPKASNLSQNNSFTSKASEKLLNNKFKQEFNTVFQEISDKNKLNYSYFLILLEKLRFIHPETIEKERNLALDIWNMLAKSDFIGKKSLLRFLLSVINPKASVLSYQQYHLLYLNRTKLLKPHKAPIEEFSFKPCISQKSVKLAKEQMERTRQGRSAIQFLSSEGVSLSLKRSSQMLKRVQSEESECTFKPTIKKYRDKQNSPKADSISYKWQKLRKETSNHIAIKLYNHSINIRRLSTRHFEQVQEFTFAPNIRRSTLFENFMLEKTQGNQYL